MLSEIRPAIVATLFFTLLLGVGYPLAVAGVAQVMFPAQANGSLIRNASGQVIAAISISGPTGRMGAAPGRRYAPLVMAAGKYLTEALVKAVR